MKHFILSHADLDGIGCVINVFNIIKNNDDFQYKLTNYEMLSKNIRNLKNEIFDVLWVLDLNLTSDHIKDLSNLECKKIIHFDHHIYEYDVVELLKTLNISDKYKFIHDHNLSSSLKLFYVMENKYESLKKMKKLFEFIDTYDMWKVNSPKFNIGYAFNDLFWEYKFEKFFNKFNKCYKLDEEDKETLLMIKEKRNEYINHTLKHFSTVNKDVNAIYIYNPDGKYINHFTLIEPKYDFYVILKDITSNEMLSYSIRIRNPNINLTIQNISDKIKKSNINVISSGGHSKVGSILIPTHENEKFLFTINNIFEEIE